MNVAIIGGGAAGFFAALWTKKHHPEAQVTILEKTTKLLSKVKVSGGGRCNVTNGNTSISKLSQAYPRGRRFMKKALQEFSTTETMQWFEDRNVPLTIQEDLHVFPVSQDSQSIIDCFLKEAQKLNIEIKTKAPVTQLIPQEDESIMLVSKDETAIDTYDKVIVATGGSPKLTGLDWLKNLDHQIELPVPSLFTFNMPQSNIRDLMGVVVNPATATIQGSKLKASGPLLITHWGMSGPAIIVLSAFGARHLSELNYQFNVQINWTNDQNFNSVFSYLEENQKINSKKLATNFKPYGLPTRLWLYLLDKCDISHTKVWQEFGKKQLNKLATVLTNDVYAVSGKTTFKEEFVTCGGISLQAIDGLTMQSKSVPNLYFAGEILDIDGVTGGYNFQAAWTTAYLASKLS